MEKLDRITINANVCLGQPTIRGMRITVSVILKMLAGNRSAKEIIEAYPELEAEDVRQAQPGQRPDVLIRPRNDH